MRIDGRLAQIERQFNVRQNHRPFILVLSAGFHEGDPEYEARLQRRIDETIRRHPKDKFRLTL